MAKALLCILWLLPTVEPQRAEQLWQAVLATVVEPEDVSGLRMPQVIMGTPSQELAREGGEVRGTYDPVTNTATAMDEKALVHELCHAALFQAKGLAAMYDELRVRGCSRGAALYLYVERGEVSDG